MKLVSWNIHGGLGRDGRRDLGRIATLLEELGCDVAALQEVGDPHRPSDVADHATWIARRLGWYVAYGPNLVIKGRPYGNAIVSRFPLDRSHNYDLSVPGREPRGCLRADVLLPDGRKLHVFNLHLGLSGDERRKQTAMVLGEDIVRDAGVTAPLVVCGDFNMWSPIPGPIRNSLRKTLRDAAVVARSRRPTWPAGFPVVRLDRAYVDGAVDVIACGVANDPHTRIASDHLPLWLVLEPRMAPGVVARKAGA